MREVGWDWGRKIGRGSIVGEEMLGRLSLERMFSFFLLSIHVHSKRARADGRYYILRDDMLGDLTRLAGEQVQGNAPWQVSPHLIVFCIALSLSLCFTFK
jgi:hypothetical protein